MRRSAPPRTTSSRIPAVIVVAKAPVAGLAKTRLARGFTQGTEPLPVDEAAHLAAEFAAAALLDTLHTVAAWQPRAMMCALTGDLTQASRSAALIAALEDWLVLDQRGNALGSRLAHAHIDAAEHWDGPTIQIGMDTPHLQAADLDALAQGLDHDQADAVVGPASDGGWWGLALRNPLYGAQLAGVRMSRGDTGEQTIAALRAAGLQVALGPELSDLDEASDLAEIAKACPADSHTHRLWQDLNPRRADHSRHPAHTERVIR